MAPRLRRKNDPAPSYGDRPDEFTVEVHHGGFFVGFGNLRTYVDGKVSWFDHCEVDTWSTLWLEDMVEELGYPKIPNLKCYWLLPGKTLADGLRVLVGDSDTNVMCSVVDRIKNLVLYFDHDDTVFNSPWDYVIENPVADLPKVVSPVKVIHIEKKQGEKLPSFYEQGQETSPTCADCGSESDEDSDFWDSENEVDDGDDDLFVDHVDEDVLDDASVGATNIAKGKKAKGSRLKGDEATLTLDFSSFDDDDELLLPDDDRDARMNRKFSSFRAEDMSNPVFKVGQIFESVVKLRAAITEYSLKNRVEIKLPRNEKTRVRAHCAEGCPWGLNASYDSRVKAITVKSYCGRHNCQKEWILKKCTAKWLANKYLDSLRANDKMSITSFAKTVQKDWNLTPTRSKLARARRIAINKIYGDESEQFNQLWDYGNEIRRSNPGSSFFLNLLDGHFSTCYMSLDPCKRGFLAGCRPLICLDGCHIKTKFGGQILTAVGIDPNDCIYPIALAVVEVECKATWKWFLETLKQDLGILNTYPWTIMSDKQKGLIAAVEELFPESEHRFCVRHLYSNFKDAGFKGEILKNQLWTCARASTVAKWEYHMAKMKTLNEAAYEWLLAMPPNTWVRAYFSEFPKSDILLNNSCEVFNKYILEAREMPILSMFERVKQQLMTRYVNKQQEMADNFVGNICPKIRKKVAKNSEFANVCYALPAGQGVFQVLEREFQYIVNIKTKVCECRKWNLTGIPCQHAISCLREERIPPETMVHDCYTVNAFNLAYQTNIMPCQDKSRWEHVDGPVIKAPVYEKKVGRPKRCRRKEPQEIQGKNGPRLSKHGVVITCSYCKKDNHNAKGCYLKKMGIRPEDYVEEEPEHHDPPPAPHQEPEHEEPVMAPHVPHEPLPSSIWFSQNAPPATFDLMTQDGQQPYYSDMMSQLSSTMLMQMMEQGTQSSVCNQPRGPLPESTFITSNIPTSRPAVLTTASKEGKAAVKRKVEHANKQEAAAKKREAAAQKREAAAQKREAAAAQKREVAAQKKKAAEARKKATTTKNS